MELSDERTEPPSCFGSRERISRAEVGAITRRLPAQGRRFYGYKLIDRQAVLAFAREVSSVALSHFQKEDDTGSMRASAES